MDGEKRAYLEGKAREIRKLALETMAHYGSGHVGASLSMADILSVLYFDKLNVDPARPGWEKRDRFVLSKGHGGPGLYAALCLKGYFEKEMLYTLNAPHTNLPSHCDMQKTPGIDQTAGSLGQGVSCAAGQALGARMLGESLHVCCLMGDGELEEGQAWEAFLFLSAKKLDNFTLIIDRNHLQNSYDTEEASRLEPLCGKFRAFGFNTLEIDGHDVAAISDALDCARAFKDGPSCIIAHTVKGRGFKAREGKPGVHYTSISDEEYAEAYRYIDAVM